MTHRDYSSKEWSRKLDAPIPRAHLQSITDQEYAFGSIDRETWRRKTDALGSADWEKAYNEVN